MASADTYPLCRGCGQEVIKGKSNRWRQPLKVPVPLADLYACSASKKGHRIEE